MTFYYSMKQMFRSPLKSFLFFLLIGVSAFFLALGGNLWNMSQTAIQEFEKIFTTIGTVEQVKKETVVEARWEADKKAYSYSRIGTYGEAIDEDVLDFEGANYLQEPRQRPFFGAYIKELYEGGGVDWTIRVEVTPLQTEVADHSVQMRIVKVLEGAVNQGDIVYVCDHFNPESIKFEAGKTYIMELWRYGFVHGTPAENNDTEERPFEYLLAGGIQSRQYTIDGEHIYDPVNEEPVFDEVTEGFYETERGKRWLLTAQTQDFQMHTIPVQPTDGTKLLMPFYQEDVVISEGRDITEEEYKQGEKVCMIPDILAMQLKKTVGDDFLLPLYFADYSISPAETFLIGGGGGGFNYINAAGELYSVFNEQEYKIVGIYTVQKKDSGSYGIGRNQVVIPWNAVPENCWKDNILAFLPMRGETTSFQIPNGTIQEYQKLWEKQGIDDLKITFYDKGYTQLKEGIDNRKMMSWIFLISGCAMAVMILLFFSNLFITGQQKRIAVERLMGKTKKQCASSILSGILVIVAVASILGSIAGWKATEAAAKKADTAITFDTTFSSGSISSTEKAEAKWTNPSILLAFATGGGLILAAFVITSCYMRENLKKEPLQLLGKLEE